MTPFEHLVAATEQRIATAKAALSASRPDDVSDLGGLVQDLCVTAVETRDAVVFDRMVRLLTRLGELQAATRLKLEGGDPDTLTAGPAPASQPSAAALTA